MTDNIYDALLKKDTEVVFDKHFYQRIYKRTERTLNAVFFLTDRLDGTQSPLLKDSITESVLSATKDMTTILALSRTDSRHALVVCSTRLIHLSSLVSLAVTRGYIRESHGGLIAHEIEAILAEIGEYQSEIDKPLVRSRIAPRRFESGLHDTAREETMHETGGVTGENGTRHEPNRRERIKDIIREKGNVGIKDISDVITDVSEKSIQRDLNDMILKGEVVRKGERRWSTYSVQSD